jgi:hypothetical protein
MRYELKRDWWSIAILPAVFGAVVLYKTHTDGFDGRGFLALVGFAFILALFLEVVYRSTNYVFLHYGYFDFASQDWARPTYQRRRVYYRDIQEVRLAPNGTVEVHTRSHEIESGWRVPRKQEGVVKFRPQEPGDVVTAIQKEMETSALLARA